MPTTIVLIIKTYDKETYEDNKQFLQRFRALCSDKGFNTTMRVVERDEPEVSILKLLSN